MKIKCRLFGHYWIFPNENLQIPSLYKKENLPLINVKVLKKPKCKRCGTEEVMLCFLGERDNVVIYWR